MFFLRSSLGIDIGNHSVRVALLHKSRHGIHVSNLVEEELNDSSLYQAFVRIKQKLKKASRFPFLLPRHQIMAVAQSQVAIKRLKFEPNLPLHEQYMQIGMQLSESLGLPYEELLYDYYSLGDQQNTLEAYACRRSLVEDKMLALVNSGYRLSALELQTQSLMRLYYKKIVQFNNNIALLVDVDFERAQLLLGDGVAKPFYHELPWIGYYSKVISSEQKEVMTEQLSLDILRQYQQISTQFPHLNVTEVWLCGAAMHQVDLFVFSQRLDCKVLPLDPFESLNCHCELIDQQAKPKWATSIGLAMRGME